MITRNKLVRAGITKVHQLVFKDLSTAEIEQQLQAIIQLSSASSDIRPLTLPRLKNLHIQVKSVLPDSLPPPINCQSTENPYLLRYGEENWRQ